MTTVAKVVFLVYLERKQMDKRRGNMDNANNDPQRRKNSTRFVLVR